MEWIIMGMLGPWPNEGDLWRQAIPQKSIEEFQALFLEVDKLSKPRVFERFTKLCLLLLRTITGVSPWQI